MSPKNPDWLPEVREFCRRSSISLSGWGADTLVVEAKSKARAAEVASLPRQFGFAPMPSEEDEQAGMLLLSRNPSATLQKQVSYDVSRRPWNEKVQTVVWLIGSLFLIPGFSRNPARFPYSYWLALPLGVLFLALLVWDGTRIWAWRLEIQPAVLRARQWFQWTTVPWEQIRSVEMQPVWARNHNAVILKLARGGSVRLGVFSVIFASLLRERLRRELAQRQSGSP